MLMIGKNNNNIIIIAFKRFWVKITTDAFFVFVVIVDEQSFLGVFLFSDILLEFFSFLEYKVKNRKKRIKIFRGKFVSLSSLLVTKYPYKSNTWKLQKMFYYYNKVTQSFKDLYSEINPATLTGKKLLAIYNLFLFDFI